MLISRNKGSLDSELQKTLFHAVHHTAQNPAVQPVFDKEIAIFRTTRTVWLHVLHGSSANSLADWLRTRCLAQQSTRKEVCGKVQNAFFPRVLTPRGHSNRQYLQTHSLSFVSMFLHKHAYQESDLTARFMRFFDVIFLPCFNAQFPRQKLSTSEAPSNELLQNKWRQNTFTLIENCSVFFTQTINL